MLVDLLIYMFLLHLKDIKKNKSRLTVITKTEGGVKTVPPTVLGTSAIAIREASPCSTAASSATASAQTYAGVLNGHPEMTEKALL